MMLESSVVSFYNTFREGRNKFLEFMNFQKLWKKLHKQFKGAKSLKLTPIFLVIKSINFERRQKNALAALGLLDVAVDGDEISDRQFPRLAIAARFALIVAKVLHAACVIQQVSLNFSFDFFFKIFSYSKNVYIKKQLHRCLILIKLIIYR